MTLDTHNNEEPLLSEYGNRFCLFPIRYKDVWAAYNKHKASFWTAQEIDFVADKTDWQRLDDNERYFIEHILAFFAGSDGIVLENIVANFSQEIPIPEVRCFYAFQSMMENIHSETYALLIATYVTPTQRQDELFNAIHTIPCVAEKAQWALRYMDPEKATFAKRLLAFGFVEGLFFSGAFCALFWLKERGLMTKSLGKSNEWIARDEGLHTEFAVLLYSYIVSKVPRGEVEDMVREAVSIEEKFICESIPCRMIGMNQEMMCQYIRHVADRLLQQFGYTPIYASSNPFPFMDKISLEGKTNFFEQRVSEYVLSSSLDTHIDFQHLRDNDASF
jgi:ribonucleotide reductase beta subunit family protein with ferritin-like domain